MAVPVFATDWPQWRGPDRNDIFKETGLLKEWPQGGPKLLWTNRDGGQGYSGPSVVGDTLYTMGSDGKSEFVFAVDVKTGKKLWSTDISGVFTEGHGDGPRGNTAVNGDLVFAISGQGEIVCLETMTGKKLWSKNMKKDLGGAIMSRWGYSESPLVDGDQVICTPGGG
jgi:outer membrane protein assembly factor BamB